MYSSGLLEALLIAKVCHATLYDLKINPLKSAS